MTWLRFESARATTSLQDLIDERGEAFDFIFIDANKDSYPTYLELSLQLSRPGTVIVADNVVRGGEVVNATSSDELVHGVRAISGDGGRERSNRRNGDPNRGQQGLRRIRYCSLSPLRSLAMRIRRAMPEDVPTIHQLIRDLAHYERELESARATPQQLHDSFFSDSPDVFCDLVET